MKIGIDFGVNAGMTVLMLSDGTSILLTSTLLVSIGGGVTLVPFKTDEGYIEDLSYVTEFWDKGKDDMYVLLWRSDIY